MSSATETKPDEKSAGGFKWTTVTLRKRAVELANFVNQQAEQEVFDSAATKVTGPIRVTGQRAMFFLEFYHADNKEYADGVSMRIDETDTHGGAWFLSHHPMLFEAAIRSQIKAPAAEPDKLKWLLLSANSNYMIARARAGVWTKNPPRSAPVAVVNPKQSRFLKSFEQFSPDKKVCVQSFPVLKLLNEFLTEADSIRVTSKLICDEMEYHVHRAGFSDSEDEQTAPGNRGKSWYWIGQEDECYGTRTEEQLKRAADEAARLSGTKVIQHGVRVRAILIRAQDPGAAASASASSSASAAAPDSGSQDPVVRKIELKGQRFDCLRYSRQSALYIQITNAANFMNLLTDAKDYPQLCAAAAEAHAFK